MYQQHKTGKNSEYLIIFSTCYHQRIHRIWRNLWAQGTVSVGWLWSSAITGAMPVKKTYCAIQKWRLKLCDAKQKQHVNGIQRVCRLLWVEARLKWTEAKSKTPFLEICIMKKNPQQHRRKWGSVPTCFKMCWCHSKRFYSFLYFWCFLCSAVNTTVVYEFCRSMHSVFISILHSVQLLLDLGFLQKVQWFVTAAEHCSF